MMKILKNVGKKLEVQLKKNGININLGNVINVIVNIQLFWNLLIIEKIIILVVVDDNKSQLMGIYLFLKYLY